MVALSQRERKRLEAMMVWERRARERGFRFIAGLDEVGRGPLAGPVVAAACILPEGALFEGINDSKKLLPADRSLLYQKILSLPNIDYGIGILDAKEIDRINILQASLQAMMIAVSRLKQVPDFLLIDGNKLPTGNIPSEAIVQGDSLSQSIAAASIIAKEMRDQLMQAYHEQWPQYQFASHKGYATEEHLLAIQEYGPCPIHRMSFEPLKSQFGRELQLDLFTV